MYLTFQEFQAKYHFNINILQFYQIRRIEQSASPRAKLDLQLQRKLETFFTERN